MFVLMQKLQLPVLIVASLATALLFGLGDIVRMHQQGGRQGRESGDISAELEREIRRKLAVEEIVSDHETPSQEREARLQRYARMLRSAERAGLRTADEELREQLVQQFGSADTFRRVAAELEQRQKIPTDLLEGWFRDQLNFAKLQRLYALSIYVTRQEEDDEFHRRRDKVKYDRFLVDPAKLALENEPGEEALQAHYEANKSKAEFQLEPEAQLEVLYANFDLMKTSDPGEEDLRSHFNAHRREHLSREHPGEAEPYFEAKTKLRVDLARLRREEAAEKLLIALDDKLMDQKAPDLLQALEAERARRPDLVAVRYARTPPTTPATESLAPLGYVSDLPGLIFAETPKSYGGPLRSDRCSYLYKIAASTPARGMTFAEARSRISEEIAAARRLEKARAVAAEWRDRLMASSDWGTLDLSAATHLLAGREEGTLESSEARAAAALKSGELSAALETPAGVAVVRLVEKITAKAEEKGKERDELRRGLEQDKAQLLQLFMGL